MASKLKLISELYDETIENVSSKSDNWRLFLKCASMNYKYNFSEQLLIYAQKPNAIACAGLETWNKDLKRWVNKGAKGIALLNDDNGYLKLRYVFDVSDTHSKYGKKIALWRVNKVYEEQVIESLENKYGELENKETLFDALKSVAHNLTEDNYSDYFNDLINNKDDTKLEFINDEVIERKYKELLQNSVAYMLINRCGLDPKPHFVETDFIEINLFNHIDTLTRFGNAVSDISEMGLREIYNTLKNIRLNEIEKIRTFDKEKNKVYDNSEKSKSAERRDFDEHRVQENGRLRDTESSSEREERTTREILNNEIELLETTQQQSLSNIDDERPVDRPLDRDREYRTDSNRVDDNSNDGTRESQRGIESERSNEVGKIDEQYQEFSRGSSNQRIDLQLNTDENTNNSILFSDGNKTDLLTEKKINDNQKQEKTQLSLFGSKEQELADRIVDIFNSFDTKWKNDLVIDKVELAKWSHIQSNKKNFKV